MTVPTYSPVTGGYTATPGPAPRRRSPDLPGVGTLYRHFPRRADLVAAVVQRDIDACAETGRALLAEREPWPALAAWLHRYAELLATKRGLASALHSYDPTFDGLRTYFDNKLEPVVSDLLAAARAAGAVRDDAAAVDVLQAVALLCQPTPSEAFTQNQRLTTIFTDRLRPLRASEPYPSE